MRAAAWRHTLSLWRGRAGALGLLALATALGFDAYVLEPVAPPGLAALGRLFEVMVALSMTLGLWLVAPSFDAADPSADASLFEAAGLPPNSHVFGVFASSCAWLFGALAACAWPWVWLGMHGSMPSGHLLLSMFGVWAAGAGAAGLGLLIGAWGRSSQAVWLWGAGAIVCATQMGRLADWTGWSGLHAWDLGVRYLSPWSLGRVSLSAVLALLGLWVVSLWGAVCLARVTRWGGASRWMLARALARVALTALIASLLTSAATRAPLLLDLADPGAPSAGVATRALGTPDLRAHVFLTAQDPRRDDVVRYFRSWAQVEVLDQRFAPERARRLRARENQTLVLTRGDRAAQYVSLEDMRRLDARVYRALSVLKRGSQPAYILTGVEGLQAQRAQPRRSRAGFERSLRDTLGLEPTALGPGDPIPKGDALVALLGPTLPLATRRVQDLITHVRDGGSLLLAIEPVYPGNEARMRPVHASLAPLVRALGVKLKAGVLEQDGEYALTARAFAVHPATDPLRRRRLFTLWEGAGALSRRVDGDARAVSLVYGPARAPLLMASTLGQGRALVASDATWLSTLALEQQPGNATLATSALSWVLQRSLPPRLAPVHQDRRVPARRPWWWVLWTWVMWPGLLGVLGRRGRA